MTGPEYLAGVFATLAEQWPFWAVLFASLGFITACSMYCFAEKWLRASICALWALLCGAAMAGGYV